MSTNTLLKLQTENDQYWTEKFRVSSEDIEHIYSIFLETETPLTSQELALEVIRFRVDKELQKLRRLVEIGEIFQPKNSYQIGQKLVFPAFDYSVGEIVSERPSSSPDYGDFTVIQVSFESGQSREFASSLKTPHQLNFEEGDMLEVRADQMNIEAVYKEYGDDIIYLLEQQLRSDKDVVYFAGRWFLRSLLADVGIAHLHLAEAVLVMHEGGPLDTPSILKEIDLAKEVNSRLQAFSLDHALFHDSRFDEVGPAGKVLWFLREMEPPEITAVPERLRYNPIEYDRRNITQELQALEHDIDDELSNFRSPSHLADSVTFSLNFPHRRIGTLPLNSHLRHLFPTAYEAPHVLMTLVDGQTGEEMNGWVARQDQYVYGLADFYRRHKLPVGAYITVTRTDDPSRVIVDFSSHKPHTEWICLAVPDGNRLVFENHKRSIGAEYDDLLALGADDLKAVDALWIPTERAAHRLPDLMKELMSSLARLAPQHTVHAKTLYSAVNVVLRCPPGPIFATLVARSEFEHVGGPYWRLV